MEEPQEYVTALPTEKKTSKVGNIYVYLVVSCVNLMMFTAGVTISWTSPVLPQLKDNTTANPFGRPITPGEESWIAGLLNLGAILGPILAGPIADRLGRKRALLVFSIAIVVSFVMTAVATKVGWYYLARLLMGVGMGSTGTIQPMYTGEVADDHNRGTLGCLACVFLTSGMLFPYVVGPFVTIRDFSLICILPLLLFLITYWTVIVETPQYLAYLGEERKLQAVLARLRNKSFNEAQEMAAELIDHTRATWSKEKKVKDLFRTKAARRGLVLMLILVSLHQLSGIRVVSAYLQTIFEIAGTGLAPEVNTIIVGVIQVVASVGVFVLVDYLGRRFLMLLSTVSCFLSLVALGFFFHLKDNGFALNGISWLPLFSLVVFITGFSVGLGPLPWALMAEIFAPNIKASATSIVNVVSIFCALLTTLSFPYLNILLGMARSFYLFALFCAVGIVFVYWCIPETKGRTLQDIQNTLESGKK